MLSLAPGSRVLLTGPTGFLGQHVLARLKDMGAPVHAACRMPPRSGDGDVTWHAADLRDPAACRALIAAIRPTHLIHAAWMAVPGQFWTSPANADWLEAGIALLRAFGEAGGSHFTGIGTCAEYDWSGETFDEALTPALPSTPYGKAKAAMAAASEAFAARYGFCATWGRVFLPYGPGDARERLIPSVLAALVADRPVDLSAGTQIRDFIHAEDAADLIVTLAARGLPGLFNIGTGTGTSVRAAVERLAALAGRPDLLRFGTLPARGGEPHRLVASMQRVEQCLGWKPHHSLESGLNQTLAAYRLAQHAGS